MTRVQMQLKKVYVRLCKWKIVKALFQRVLCLCAEVQRMKGCVAKRVKWSAVIVWLNFKSIQFYLYSAKSQQMPSLGTSLSRHHCTTIFCSCITGHHIPSPRLNTQNGLCIHTTIQIQYFRSHAGWHERKSLLVRINFFLILDYVIIFY